MKSNKEGYLPLPDFLTIKKSKLHGLGLFATKDIPADYDLGISHVADPRFPDGYIRTPIGAFVNHSSSPNCIFIEGKDIFRLKTIKRVKKGEELTDKYTNWYDEELLRTYN